MEYERKIMTLVSLSLIKKHSGGGGERQDHRAKMLILFRAGAEAHQSHRRSVTHASEAAWMLGAYRSPGQDRRPLVRPDECAPRLLP